MLAVISALVVVVAARLADRNAVAVLVACAVASRRAIALAAVVARARATGRVVEESPLRLAAALSCSWPCRRPRPGRGTSIASVAAVAPASPTDSGRSPLAVTAAYPVADGHTQASRGQLTRDRLLAGEDSRALRHAPEQGVRDRAAVAVHKA